MNNHIFVRLTKVDEAKREVWGRATEEAEDKSGEVFDYGTSKPYFERWSNTIADATDGKSLGNLRAMHGKVAAGKLIAIEYNDVDKAIDIGTKVVDDAEWNKVLEGVYTGFSIGGKYIKRWKGDDELQRFTADPSEISLVDNPCLGSARFYQVIKMDGTTEEHALKIAERSDTSAKDGEDKYGDVKFADEKNKKYPIDTAAHIRAAWNYINKEKNAGKYDSADLKTIKSHIIAAWKEKIDKNGPPSAKDTAAKAETITVGALRKNMYTVGNLVDTIQSLAYMCSNTQYEAEYEGDNSIIPEAFLDWIKDGAELLEHMLEEELEELLAALEPAKEEAALAMAAKASLKKVGAKFSGESRTKLADMHDIAKQLVDGFEKLGYDIKEETDDNNDDAKGEKFAKKEGDMKDDEKDKKKDDEKDKKKDDEKDKKKDDEKDKKKDDKADDKKKDDKKKDDDDGEKALTVSDMKKLLEDRDANFAKQLSDMKVDKEALEKRIADMEAQPAAAKGPLLAVDGKVATAGATKGDKPDLKPICKGDGTVDEAATMIKGQRAGYTNEQIEACIKSVNR